MKRRIFGSGGGGRIAAETGLTLLGQIPLDAGLEGQPTAEPRWWWPNPINPVSLRFREVARRVAARLSLQSRNQTVRMPKIKIVE